MSVKAITFDFWDTLFPRLGREGTVEVADARAEEMHDFLSALGHDFTLGQCHEAYDAANRGHLEHWVTGMFQPTIDEALDTMEQELGLDLDEPQRAELALRLQCRAEVMELQPFPGVAELLPELAGRYKLGIISDTWLTPGEVPRMMMEQRGLLDLFSAFVFSDESGFLKPHERQFRVAVEALGVSAEEVIHVGDSERRDVAGALALGMKAVLLDWDGKHDASKAHAVIRSFRELGPAIERLAGSA